MARACANCGTEVDDDALFCPTCGEPIGLNLWLRFRLEEGSKIPFFLSLLGVIVIGFGGWLGGEMVYVKGMAVEAMEQLAKKEKKSDSRQPQSIRRAG